jgi:hypothetical protein
MVVEEAIYAVHMTPLRSELAIFHASGSCGSRCIRSDFSAAKCPQQFRVSIAVYLVVLNRF